MIFSKNDRIVFIGDSVTDMGSLNPVGEGNDDCLGRSYVAIINSLLWMSYPELVLRVTNSGISGQTSRDLIARFDRDVMDLNPDWVSICIGINDVWRQFDRIVVPECHVYPDEYRKNMEEMVGKLNGKVKGTFIMSPYIMATSKDDKMRARMDEYVAICKDVAEKNGCVFINLQQLFDNYLENQYGYLTSPDRIHPNQLGATVIAREFLKHCDYDFNREEY